MIILKILAGYLCAGVATTMLFMAAELCLGFFEGVLQTLGRIVPREKVAPDKWTALDWVKWFSISAVVWPYALCVFASELYEQIHLLIIKLKEVRS